MLRLRLAFWSRFMNQTGLFNPLLDLQVSAHSRPAELSPVNLRALTPFQRALLVIDGTVTKFIEAYQLESVETQRLKHERHRLLQTHPTLEATQDALVLQREVQLVGAMTGRLYGLASAIVLLESLPESVQSDLESEHASLGRVLNQHRCESRREILWFGRGRPHQKSDLSMAAEEGEYLIRSYRIIMGGRPVALISEHFPSRLDERPIRD